MVQAKSVVVRGLPGKVLPNGMGREHSLASEVDKAINAFITANGGQAPEGVHVSALNGGSFTDSVLVTIIADHAESEKSKKSK